MRPHPFQLSDLSGHPDFAARIGEIIALSSKLEFHLSILFTLLLRAPPWTIWTAWHSLYNSNARLAMIRNLAMELQDEIPEKKELLILIARVSKSSNARNEYVHKPWLLAGENLYQLDMPALEPSESQRHHVSIKRLEHERDSLRSLCDDVNGFVGRFSNAYPLPIDPNLNKTPRPWPGKLRSRKARQTRNSDHNP